MRGSRHETRFAVFRCFCVTLSLDLFFAIAGMAHAGDLENCLVARGQIARFVRDIDVQSDRDRRVGEALTLSDYVRGHSVCARHLKTIEKLETLLNDDDDGVRMGAAMALGYVDPLRRLQFPRSNEQ